MKARTAWGILMAVSVVGFPFLYWSDHHFLEGIICLVLFCYSSIQYELEIIKTRLE